MVLVVLDIGYNQDFELGRAGEDVELLSSQLVALALGATTTPR